MKDRTVVLAACAVLIVMGCAKNDDQQSDVLEQTDKSHVALPSDTMGVSGADDPAPATEADCVFQIDVAKSHRLRFDDFVREFPKAYVKLSFEIDAVGQVVRTFDEDDGGQPAALSKFAKSVRNWKYKGGCLKGTIRIEVNANAARVTIDDSRLEIVSGFENLKITRGPMHGVVGGDIGVIKGSLSR